MRVGIIGGGFGLRVQAPIILTHPSMKLVAVSTMNRHKLTEESREKTLPVHYTDWIQMLDHEKLDLIIISSLPKYHYSMVRHAMNKGVHVICEKPFTMNSQESNDLLNLSNTNEVKIFIDFEWRYLAIRQKAKELLSHHAIGTLLHLEYHISSPEYQKLQSTVRGWMGEKNQFGGMLGALGTHMIDCLRWLEDDEIEQIHGLTHTHVPLGSGEQRDADDAFFIHGTMRSGSTFSIQFLSGINHAFGSNLKMFGSSGTLQIINDKTLWYGRANEPLQEIPSPIPITAPSTLSVEAQAYYPAFYTFLDKVYDYIANNKKDKDLPTIVDGHANQLAIEKIIGNIYTTKKA
ncbi:Gfo/Idh/MocA family protein [Paenibacillus sp. EC2-1]|uniref:Gfo/Idh/MocA family protein n=1 Tax=Paenibacillus sp. EC2-1 TaxID=3388665 RepID=UPI003BEF0FE4